MQGVGVFRAVGEREYPLKAMRGEPRIPAGEMGRCNSVRRLECRRLAAFRRLLGWIPAFVGMADFPQHWS